MENIKIWYQGLEESEQKIVIFAAIFFATVIFIFGILKPLNDKVKQVELSVKGKQSMVLEWQQAMPKLLAARGGSSASSGGQSLSSVVTASTKRFNLRVSRVQEKGSEEIQVWFDNVAFNDFARWVSDLNGRYKVTVSSVNIRSKDKDGLSSIDVKLQKG